MSRQNDMVERYAELKCTPEQIAEIEETFARADAAQREFEKWDQAAIDRTIQPKKIVANSKTFHELVELGIQESAFGDPISREAKRFKIRGILRDCLREKSVGIIEEIPREENRQIRQARWRHRLRHPGHQPRPHPGRQCHLRHQGP